MSEFLAPVAVGLAAGAVMARGGLCFNRAVRRAAFEQRPRLLRAFAVAIAVQLLLAPILVAADVDPFVRSAEAGGLPLLPVAQVAGGLVFGAGMALAGGCVTGMLWKAGSGSVALMLAIGGFVAGELLIRGPGSELIGALDDAARPDARSLAVVVGVDYAPLAAAIGLVLAVLVLRRGWSGAASGAALGAVAAAAWLAADAAGYGYGLGFVGAADGTRTALERGAEPPYQLYLALGVIAGAALAASRRLRVPDAARASRALGGGFLMGVGGSLAHGCNIGHGLTGIPLLSFGSLLATAAMVAGALLAWRFVLAPSPRLRGVERAGGLVS